MIHKEDGRRCGLMSPFQMNKHLSFREEKVSQHEGNRRRAVPMEGTGLWEGPH